MGTPSTEVPEPAHPTPCRPPGVSSIPDHLKPLFTPLQLSKQLQLSNRMVYAPLTRCRAVNNITPPETALYCERCMLSAPVHTVRGDRSCGLPARPHVAPFAPTDS